MKKTKLLAFRGGSYSLLLTAVVLAILIVVNVFVSVLPSSLTKLDISAAKLYSVTSNTKALVSALEKDVTVYWIVQADQEDAVLDNLLSRYDSLSPHLSVVKKNPDVFPTFAAQYTDETVSNNSLVVECGDRYRYVAYTDIYLQEADLYSYSYNTSFDGEGAITSAIDYVVSETLPVIYVLEGHGEAELPAVFGDQVEKENYERKALSLLNVDAIPEDASCILIYAPQSDISAEEKAMLADYLTGGGKLFVMAGPIEDVIPENLNSLLGDYGVSVREGIVIESDRAHYAFQQPLILLPDLTEHAITSSLIEANYYAIMPIAAPLAPGSSSAVTSLMNTTPFSYSKLAGYAMESYEQEDGDLAGPFSVGVSIDAGNGGQLVWFSSADFLTDMYNAYSSGANCDLAMNVLSDMIGEREAIAIRSKSLNYNYLTITESEGATLKAVMIGVLPVLFLAVGVIVTVRTRRKQNEAN